MMRSYDASNIKRTTGASKHREQVARYLGATDCRGILNQFTEIYDNALDETIEYHSQLCRAFPNTKIPPLNIYITITDTDDVTISDEGRGLPCDIHPDTNEPAIYLIFEDDSAGGKGNHSQGGYENITSGMHGAGACVSKSCTEYFRVEARNKNIYNLQYIEGERVDDLQLVGHLEPHKNPILKDLGLMYTGTTIDYRYDKQVFSATLEGSPVDAYDYETIKTKLTSTITGLANPDAVRIQLDFKGNKEEINPNDYKPSSLLKVEEEDLITIPIKSTRKEPTEKDYFIGTIYLAKNSLSQSTVIVNRLSINPGSIEKAIRERMLKFFLMSVYNSNNYKHFFQDEMQKYSIVVIMSLIKPEFSGQSKQYLTSSSFLPEMKNLIYDGFLSNKERFTNFFREVSERISNMEVLKREHEEMLRRQNELQEAKAREEERKKKIVYDRKVEENKTTFQKINDQLDMENNNVVFRASKFKKEECTLVLVEGASVSDAIGDEVANQPIEIYGIGGKPTNVYKTEITSDSKIKSLLHYLTIYNYKSVKILTDADSDGVHMKILLLALINQFNPELISKGKVSVIKSPFAKTINQTNTTITIDNYNIRPNEFYYPTDAKELSVAESKGFRLLTKYNGLADSVMDTNLKLIDLLTNPQYSEPIGILTKTDINILKDILSTESTMKKSFITDMKTKRYKQSDFLKFVYTNLERFRPDYTVKYNPTPQVTDYYK